MPESALTAPKEKKLSGRQWFESGRHAAVVLKDAYFAWITCHAVYI